MEETQAPVAPNPMGSVREHRIVLDGAEIKAAVERRAGAAQPNVQMPGFRPGKAPVDAIVQKHGAQFRIEAENELIARKMDSEVINQIDLNSVLGDVVFLEIVNGDASGAAASDAPADQSVVYSVRYETCPEIPAPDLGQIKLERIIYKITDDDVRQWVTRNFNRNPLPGAPEPGRVAQFGDAVLVNIVGHVEGEKVYDLGEKGLMTRAGMSPIGVEVNMALVGAKAGDVFRYRQPMPADHEQERFRGKTAVFELKVLEVAPVLSTEPSDELAKAAGFENVAQLLEQARREAEGFARHHARNQLHADFRKALSELNTAEMPKQVVWHSAWREVQLHSFRLDHSRGVTEEDLAEAEFALRGLTAHNALVRSRQLQPTADQMVRASVDWLNPLPPTNEQLQHFQQRVQADQSGNLQHQMRTAAERELLLDIALQECQVIDMEVDFATLWA